MYFIFDNIRYFPTTKIFKIKIKSYPYAFDFRAFGIWPVCSETIPKNVEHFNYIQFFLIRVSIHFLWFKMLNRTLFSNKSVIALAIVFSKLNILFALLLKQLLLKIWNFDILTFFIIFYNYFLSMYCLKLTCTLASLSPRRWLSSSLINASG